MQTETKTTGLETIKEVELDKENLLFGVFPRSAKRLRELFIYYWFFSVLGHYSEIVAGYMNLTGGWHPKMPTITPLAPPYGFGTLAAILFVVPLKEKYKLNPALIFIIGMVVMMLVELICGVVIVMMYGYNPFWDYSHMEGNILGQTCMHNGLFFGIMSMVFVYVFYPLFEKVLDVLGDRKIRIIFWVLATTYGIDLIHTTLCDGWLG